MKWQSKGAQASVLEADRTAPSVPCGCLSLKLVVLDSFAIGGFHDTLQGAAAGLHAYICQYSTV
jgi:hypothetical protein